MQFLLNGKSHGKVMELGIEKVLEKFEKLYRLELHLKVFDVDIEYDLVHCSFWFWSAIEEYWNIE